MAKSSRNRLLTKRSANSFLKMVMVEAIAIRPPGSIS
jgi:hypothetical protein